MSVGFKTSKILCLSADGRLLSQLFTLTDGVSTFTKLKRHVTLHLNSHALFRGVCFCIIHATLMTRSVTIGIDRTCSGIFQRAPKH